MATTDRAADVRIKGNAPAGGRNALSAAEQKALQAKIDASVAAVGKPATAAPVDPYTEYLKGKEAQQRIDWIAQLQATFKQYGLESLAPKITEFVQQGYSQIGRAHV